MKLGRPKLKTAEKKATIAGVRLRADERALVERAAKKRNQNLSLWMRTALVNAANFELKS